ncbi:hypothetical protein AN958_08619 [Leucoagaricus sp. SymC.cos]|nr:hypothetical protein AN958_08619 [Leucoagaricus sp. SymC.cos]
MSPLKGSASGLCVNHRLATYSHLLSSFLLQQMTVKDVVKLLDLPTEVLEQILAYLDPESLLTLGKVNHFFNHLALRDFFGPSVHHIQMNKIVPPYPHPEDLLLSGLCIALWLDNVAELEQRIVGDIHQSIWQFCKLITFVKRLHSLKSLILRISIVLPCWGWREYRLEGDLFVAELHRLMEIAVEKGCENLHIEGNSIPHCRLSAAGIRQLRSTQTITKRAWKWMKNRVPSFCIKTTDPLSHTTPDMAASPTPSRSPTPRIATCVLHRPALLGTTALPYIGHLLKCNAETITLLDMNCFGLTRSYWKARALSLALFDSIHLPNLSKLALIIQVSTIPSNSFAWFLARHSGISYLKITDPSNLPHHPSRLVLSKRHPFSLPYLKTIDLPARVAEWLFVSMNPTVTHSLESVRVHAHSCMDVLARLGDAIRVLRRQKDYVDTLILDAYWRSYGDDLLHGGWDKLSEQDESCLLDVRKLVLVYGEPFFCQSTFPVRLVGMFARVVKLFPSVTELEIKDREHEDFRDATGMRERIMEECPTLLSVQC